jgi:hypothetical protein
MFVLGEFCKGGYPHVGLCSYVFSFMDMFNSLRSLVES